MKKKSAKINCVIFLAVSLFHLTIPAQDFTWVNGPSVMNQLPVYGTLGVSSPLNNPGARSQAMTWKDASGNFWLFGGYGYDNFGNIDILNDLWKYNPLNNEWSWVNGDSMVARSGNYGIIAVPAATNKPGARSNATTWRDASGNFWMFGGFGIDAASNYGEHNDLWKYDVTANQWTWMKGSTAIMQGGSYGLLGVSAPGNNPGARSHGQAWSDANGNFYLFGGLGFDVTNINGYLNDMWQYNVASNEWTWLNGDNVIDQPGIYGTIGVQGATNKPGARFASTGWTDANGNLWMFGGIGIGTTPQLGSDAINDLWKYNIVANQWTWIRGSNNILQAGVYGLKNYTSVLNTPGARFGSITWDDGSGNIWMFGGIGLGTSSTSLPDLLSDLWRFDKTTYNWTWVKGTPLPSQLGIYGTLSTASPLNIPGTRFGVSGWVDQSNHLWIFGGEGYDGSTNTNYGELNDLWKLNMCVAPTLTIMSTNTVICGTGNVTVTATGAATYSWSNLQTGSVVVINPSSNTNYTINSTDANGCYSAAMYSQMVAPVPTLAIVSNTNGACPGTAISLTVSGASSYSWNTTQTNSVIVISPSVTSEYTVLGMAAGCYGIANYTANVLTAPVLQISSSSNPLCLGQVATLSVSGTSSYSWHTNPGSSATFYTVSPQFVTSYSVTGIDSNGCATIAGIVQNVSSCSGVGENLSSKQTLIIYPNPNNGEFRINGADHLVLIILNSLGQKVYEKTISNSEPIQTDLSKGIYYYRLMAEDLKFSSGKLVIE